MPFAKKKIIGDPLLWIRSAYGYAAAIISLVICVIGTITITNLVIREYVFGVHGSWYSTPESSCDQILQNAEDRYLSVPIPASIPVRSVNEMNAEQLQQYYDFCMKRETNRISTEQRHQLARDFSTGFSMLVVGVPLLIFHLIWLRKKDL